MSSSRCMTQRVKKAPKGCWSCKKRKVGCDKALPHCNNCLRINRVCEGYGIKLSWPEAGDGRRPPCKWGNLKAPRISSARRPHVNSGYYFLNTTYEDIYFVQRGHGPQCRIPLARPLKGLKFGYELTTTASDGNLLLYYTNVLSRMITTIDDGHNGFRTVLLPEALSHTTLASQSLRYTILALSAAHLGRHGDSTEYKVLAIKLLSDSIRSGEDTMVGQFATCMMFCVCDVFDCADNSWYIHLGAAKKLIYKVRKEVSGPDVEFLESWMAYHDVLAAFSHGTRELEDVLVIPTLPRDDGNSNRIVGSLGCSMQVLECISCINTLGKLSRGESHSMSLDLTAIAYGIKTQLETLLQIPDVIYDDTSGQIEHFKIETTAEAYRLGTLIYLHQTISSSKETFQSLVQKSLDTLESLPVCTSPWPLFVTSCEVVGDTDRLRVLNMLDNMQRKRRISNVDIMRGIIEAVWKHGDLLGERSMVDWRYMVGLDRILPSFI